MGEPGQSGAKTVLRGALRVLAYVGGAIFLFGGKFFSEIEHKDFIVSEVSCMAVGIVVMLVSGGLRAGLKARVSDGEK